MTETRVSTLFSIGAAVLTWAVVSTIALFLVLDGTPEARREAAAFGGLCLFYLAALLVATRPCNDRRDRLRQRVALWLQLASALTMGFVVQLSILPIYTIVWIAIAATVFTVGTSAISLVAVMVGWYAIASLVWVADDALISTLLYGTFHLFAFLSSRSVSAAEAARDEVEKLNRELVATQHLLSAASRQSERTRIARDLHDLLGHHLTALSINLQIAERVAAGDAKPKIAECRALARLLLSDVRDAVSTLRESDSLDFARAVRLLLENVPQLKIELDLQKDLKIDDIDVAESLLRCIQECTTNTLRHADARRSWVRIWREDRLVKLQVHDDGTAAVDTIEGYGLTGMRERIARLGGSFKLDRVQQALCVRVEIPLAE